MKKDLSKLRWAVCTDMKEKKAGTGVLLLASTQEAPSGTGTEEWR